MHSLLQLARNPVFRHELRRAVRWRWTVALSVVNCLYVGAFAVAYQTWLKANPWREPGYGAEFHYFPWFMAGAGILSLCTHWLIPPFVLWFLRDHYELRTLSLLVSEEISDEESLRAQVCASVTPLIVALIPLVVLIAMLLSSTLHYGLVSGAILLGGLLWGTFCTMVSLWSGVTFRRPLPAHLWAYLLGSFVFPFLFAGLSIAVGLGCSAGQAHEEVVFATAGMLTWALLVIGFAATFWDLAFGQVFPERRVSLWRERPRSERDER